MKKILTVLMTLFLVTSSAVYANESIQYKDSVVPVIKSGIVNQKMPILNLKESQRGALDKGSYCLKIKPEGNYVTFNSEAVLKSSDGEKILDNIEISGDTIDFDIRYESDTASTISLSNVYLTAQRNAPGGQYHIYLYNKKDMDNPIFDVFYFYISQSNLISPDAIGENPEDIKKHMQENNESEKIEKTVDTENISQENLFLKIVKLLFSQK